MRIIGDVHGKQKEYRQIAEASPDGLSVQIGDMGFDYSDIASMDSGHQFFMGNHDNWDLNNDYGTIPNLLDGYYGSYFSPFQEWTNEFPTFFYVAGSISIDMLARVRQYMNGGPKTWWYEEEIPQNGFDNALDSYKVHLHYCKKYNKPVIFLSHDCPLVVKKYIKEIRNQFDLTRFGFYKGDIDCRTQLLLHEMYKAHQPDLWIFGHWHRNMEKKLGNTLFLCLDELKYVDITIEDDILKLNGEII